MEASPSPSASLQCFREQKGVCIRESERWEREMGKRGRDGGAERERERERKVRAVLLI